MNISDEFFFNEDAYKPSLWDESWDYMKHEGIVIHETPQTIPYKKFPSILSRFHWGKGLAVIAPRPDWNSILIPFSPDFHDEEYFNERLISEIVGSLIEAKPSRKYIASARPSCCFFAEIDELKYEIFGKVAGTNEDKPFFLFDDTLSYCLGFDFDFPYCFYSSKNLELDDERLMGTFAEWDKYFVENFFQNAPTNSLHMKLFESVLRPSIPRQIDLGRYAKT